MRSILENNFLTVEVESFGAELKSLRSKETEREYMWSADAKYWGKTSPVLFPVVGCLKDDKIVVDGQDYSLSRHGFARDNEFELIEESESCLRYRLSSSEQTLKVFPYEFQFDIIYTLEAKSLMISYEVSNPSSKELIYSLGGHPAFNCQWQDGDGVTDYHLDFQQEENSQKLGMDLPLLNGERIDCLAGQRLDLTETIFDDDALIFDDLKSKYVDFKRNDYEGEFLRFDFGSFPYLGIWSAPAAPFVCLEPWAGLADSVDHDSDYSKKEATLRLAAQEKSQLSYIISIL